MSAEQGIDPPLCRGTRLNHSIHIAQPALPSRPRYFRKQAYWNDNGYVADWIRLWIDTVPTHHSCEEDTWFSSAFHMFLILIKKCFHYVNYMWQSESKAVALQKEGDPDPKPKRASSTELGRLINDIEGRNNPKGKRQKTSAQVKITLLKITHPDKEFEELSGMCEKASLGFDVMEVVNVAKEPFAPWYQVVNEFPERLRHLTRTIREDTKQYSVRGSRLDQQENYEFGEYGARYNNDVSANSTAHRQAGYELRNLGLKLAINTTQAKKNFDVLIKEYEVDAQNDYPEFQGLIRVVLNEKTVGQVMFRPESFENDPHKYLHIQHIITSPLAIDTVGAATMILDTVRRMCSRVFVIPINSNYNWVTKLIEANDKDYWIYTQDQMEKIVPLLDHKTVMPVRGYT